MKVEAQVLTRPGILVDPEHARAFRVERSFGNQLAHGFSGHEAGVELHQWRRPEPALRVGVVQERPDVRCRYPAEAPGEPTVVRNDRLAERENVHLRSRQQIFSPNGWVSLKL